MEFQIMNNEREAFARQLDAASWGLFTIWIGIALLIDVGWGWGLLGVAAIILGGGVIRWFKGLPIQGFWVAIGLILLVCALWELFGVSWPLIPVLIKFIRVSGQLSSMLHAKEAQRGRPHYLPQCRTGHPLPWPFRLGA